MRRYGVTVVSYTWTMVRDLVEAPPQPGERHHSVRLFMGAGMPRGLWRRTTKRFSPARVLEFYASTEGEAVLVNLRAQARRKGRPLPGSAEVRIAAYDARPAGWSRGPTASRARPIATRSGMLLARVRGGAATLSETPLRGVFARDDSWLATGDMFRRDADGDHWLVDHVRALIRTADGPVPSLPIQDALSDLDAVDLSVAYGVPVGEDGHELAVGAVTLRHGQRLSRGELGRALLTLPEHERPAVVHVVRKIPLTTWYRPLTAPLRKAGLPAAGRGASYRDGEEYRVLTPAALAQLQAGG